MKSYFNFRNLVFLFICGCVISFSACGEKTEKGNPEADSLRGVISGNMAEMDEMNLFLDAVNISMDSIVNMNGDVLKTSGESPKSTKQQIMDNLSAYKLILQHQRERIALLEQKLDKSDAKSQKMLQIIASLKKQIEEKDQAIVELTEELQKRNVDISTLKAHVEKLNTHVAELTETNKAQEETLNSQSDMLNEAYYIIGTKNELISAGVMKKGSLFKKSKLSTSEMNTSSFHKIDIRKTKSFSIPGRKPQLLTQAPAGSYSITENSNGTCTLTITDPSSFWSISNYLVIRY